MCIIVLGASFFDTMITRMRASILFDGDLNWSIITNVNTVEWYFNSVESLQAV